MAVFKEIVADLETLEVKYDEDDLGLILLCPLPSLFSSFRDTILYSHDTHHWKQVWCLVLKGEDEAFGWSWF